MNGYASIPTPTYDICALGNAIVDIVADVPEGFLQQQHIPKDTMMLVDHARITLLRKLLKGARVVRAGGAAGNVVAGIASFGGTAAYMGKIGSDEVGHLFSADLNRLGIHFPLPHLAHKDVPTGLCLSLVGADAQRSMCTYLGASIEFGVNDVQLATVQAAQTTFLEGYMFDRATTRMALQLAAATARTAKRKVALALCDPFCVERNRAEFLDLVLTKTDILFANERELAALYKTSSLEAAIGEVKTHMEMAIITRSEKGAIIVHGGEQLVVPAERVPHVVDKTGAGDAFAAGFLYGLARKRDLMTCSRLGSVAAAEVISHYGPRPEHSLAELAKQKGLMH